MVKIYFTNWVELMYGYINHHRALVEFMIGIGEQYVLFYDMYYRDWDDHLIEKCHIFTDTTGKYIETNIEDISHKVRRDCLIRGDAYDVTLSKNSCDVYEHGRLIYAFVDYPTTSY